MSNSYSLRLGFGVLLSILCVMPALAQQALCQRLRAELAALDNSDGGSDPRLDAAAARQRAEIARTTNYFRSLGCEGRGFMIFNAPPPPECGALAARIEQMQMNHARLAQQAERGGGGRSFEIRRQQLIAAMTQACRVQAEPSGPNGLYEALFGRARPDIMEERPGMDIIDDEENRPRGGGKAVCVRTCDGFFFPMNNLPSGRDGADSMCQALCPGTEARAYFMPGGNGVIEQAVSTSGEPYTSLPNASRYQKAFDHSCSCRQKGQSWLQALKSAEEMIERRRGDIIVTVQKAEELSRAKTVETTTSTNSKTTRESKAKLEASLKEEERRKELAARQEADAIASMGAAAPTASTESAGIGPQKIEGEKVISRNDGARAVVTDEDGTRRQVRIVGADKIAPFRP